MTARARVRQPAAQAYLIEGNDSFLRTQFREEIVAANVPEKARGFAVAQFSLERDELAEVLAQALMRPMLSPRQVLVVTDAEALDEEELGALEEYLAAPVDFSVLVFEAAKLDGRTRPAKFLKKHCELRAADSPEDSDAIRGVEQQAHALGLQLDRATAEDLVYLLGTDQGRLHAELEKLRAFVGSGREVTRNDLRAIVSAAREFVVFDLVEPLARRRRGEALQLVRQLLEKGENPIGIVGLLGWLYRQLLQAQALPRSTPPWKAAKLLGARAAQVEVFLQQARAFSRGELQGAFAALRDADVALKSSAPHPEAVLETLIVRLTPRPAYRAGA